jgi:hypothetical protein
MTQYIVFIAMLSSILVVRRQGLESAFLQVWIPFFLCLPFSFWVNIPGLPDPNFMQAAIIPILVVLVRERLHALRIGPMEALLLLYVAIRVVADFVSRGYSDAQNYGFYLLTSVIGPFLLGRYIIRDRRMDIATSRMFVLVFLVFFPFFLFEATFWVSPVYKVFSGLFPGAGSGLSMRWGIARTAGTFEHPILACVMIIAVYRLHRWLCWTGAWDGPQTGASGWIQRRAAVLPIPFPTLVSVVLVLMALMTISRGPWIGGFAAAALVAVGNFSNRRKWLVIVLAGFLLGGLAGKAALDSYITPEQGQVLTGEAQTMLYRKVMVERYQEFLLEKKWSGWGLTTVPKIKGMESVDNAFFLMALQHGVFAPTVFAIMFLMAIFSQVRFGMQAPPGTPPLGFTFSGIYLMCFIAFSTVYMGAQTEPMLFLLLGWGESIKARKAEASGGPQTSATAGPAPPFRSILR